MKRNFVFCLLFALVMALNSCSNDLDEVFNKSNKSVVTRAITYDFRKIVESETDATLLSYLNSALVDVCSHKEYDFLYQVDVSKGYAFASAVVDPNIPEPATATYNVENRTLAFYTASAANELTLTEEFLHMNQHYLYNGLGKYWTKGMSNIEFEAKFVQDVINYRINVFTQLLGRGDGHINDYYDLMDKFKKTEDFPVFSEVKDGVNGCNWWTFVEDFRTTNSHIKPYAVPVDGTLEGKLVNFIGKNN